ncbi:cytochrome P450 [Aspergillus ellipticus CBS 707.79]|uniref:Cytochrome P450 n=1 Tax=Aspergillus ellipticus CBS 707.79 TaxID=1448320 RepID=A0A319DBL3_9EURO|nr:cytochrome P450 [Aspergillus ellipticus CBS 707.79]
MGVVGLDHGALLLVPLILYILFRLQQKAPADFAESIPVVGLRNEVFKTARASFRQLLNGLKTITDGYREFSRHGKPFLIQEPSFQKELMLPPEHVKWALQLPDSQVDSKDIRLERHAVGYLHKGVDFDSTLFFLDRIIGDSLTRKLDMIQQPMCEEIRSNIDSIFGDDETNWKTLNAYDSLQDIVLVSMSRVFFGSSLCHDQTFLTLYSRYILVMGIGTIVIGELPSALKGLIVPIINLPLRYYRRRTLNALLPMTKERLSEYMEDQQKDFKEHYDFISQSARVATKVNNAPDTSNPESLAEWIMLLGFAAMSSTVIQSSNMLLDILHSPPEFQTYECLREEASTVLAREDDWNHAPTFKKLQLADSVIRESLRHHPILIKGLSKAVVAKSGLDLPDGTHVPHGSWLGVPVVGIHMDDRFYPNPQAYDPFRFVKLKEQRDLENSEKSDENPTAKKKTRVNDLDAGQPTTTYLGFGYGRHACPGRWFAVQMLKIMMAYLTINYEIEAVGPRPETKTFGDAALPPISANIHVRRRRGTACG